ncbi:MAG: hypothetical protein U0869_08265 [Chloroflexota bacterium]
MNVGVQNLPSGKAVKGYFLSEDPNANPNVADPGWKLQPTKFALSSDEGPHTIYAWAKYTGGVRSVVAASDTVNLDTVAPVVSNFDVTEALSTSRTVHVTFDPADDQDLTYNSGLFKYAVVNGTVAPDLSSPLWKDVQPTTVLLTKGNGTKTVSAFVRDRANNVSAVASDTVDLDLGTPALTFTMPAGTKSRTVAINVSATDPSGSGITGYFVKEGDTTPPTLTAAGWKVKPSSFTLSAGQGTKTLYAWAKDGNGSMSAMATATTVLDISVPVAALAYTGAVPSTSRTITLSTAGSSDNTGITKWALVDGTALPTLASAWKSVAPTSWVLPTGNGFKNVTLFVKDAAGNVSTGATVSVNLQLAAPTVTLNVIPLFSKSTTVAINLHATDHSGTGIAGWIVKQTNTPPAASDTGWKPQPTTFVLSGADGTKTVYAWAKDKNGSVSLAASDTVGLDRTGPTFTFTLHGSPVVYANDIAGVVDLSGVADYGVVVSAGGSIPSSSAVTVWQTTDLDTVFSAVSGQRVTVFIRDVLGNVSIATDGVTSQLVP